MAAESRAVCTAVIGGYELLTEQALAKTSVVPFVCFTDDPTLRSSTWEVRQIQPRWPSDPVRSAREVKIRLDRHLPDVSQTLWIDNSVELRTPPESLLDGWLGESELAVPLHSYRADVLAEFAEVATLGLDDVTRVYEQEAHYRVADPGVLAERVLWTGILARRMGRPSVAFSTLWMEHVLRYSRRDQLSVNFALRCSGLRHRRVELDNFDSPVHRWPVARERLPDGDRRHYSGGFIPQELARASCDARLRALQRQLDDLRERLGQAVRENADLAARAARYDAVLAALGSPEQPEREVARLRDAEQALGRVLASRSYRLAAGLRRARGAPRR